LITPSVPLAPAPRAARSRGSGFVPWPEAVITVQLDPQSEQFCSDIAEWMRLSYL
jgi:hypothetical protein